MKKIKGFSLLSETSQPIIEGYGVEARYRRLPREVRVGSEWEFPTLHDAVGELRNASVNNRYTIKLANEEIVGNVTLPPYVSLEGSGKTLITGTLTIENSECRIQNVSIDGGSAAALLLVSSSVNMLGCDITNNIELTGETEVEIFSSQLNDGLLLSNSSNTQGSRVVGCLGDNYSIRRVYTGVWLLELFFSKLSSSGIYMLSATHQIRIINSKLSRLDGLPAVRLQGGVANSFVSIAHSTVISSVGINTIEKSGGVGNLEVWTYQNGFSAGFGVGVNENIAAGNNITDAQLAGI